MPLSIANASNLAPGVAGWSASTSRACDPETMADPRGTFARLREEAPIRRGPALDGSPAWYVTRAADVRSVLGDPRFVTDPRVVPGAHGTGAAILAALGVPDELTGYLTDTILESGGADHTRLRKPASRAFTAGRVAALRPRVQATTDELLDAVTGPVDLVEALTHPLPIAVICELVGVPEVDRPLWRQWSVARLGVQPELFPARLQAIVEHVRERVAWRRIEPADDLVTALVAARDEGGRLTEDEMITLLLTLVSAGHTTTPPPTSSRPGRRSARARRYSRCWSRPTPTRASTPIPSGSTSPGATGCAARDTSGSGTASTTASVHRWRVCRPRSRCGRCPRSRARRRAGLGAAARRHGPRGSPGAPERVTLRTRIRGALPIIWPTTTRTHDTGATQMDEYRPGPPRSPTAAALLNLTGPGLGYSYLGRWWRQVLHLVITAGLVVIAFATGAAALPWLWAAVAVGWLGWMAVDAGRLARDLHARPVGAARAVPVAVAVVLVGALVTGYVLYGAAGGRAYADAAAARDRGDCATAVDGFGTVTGRYELTLSGDVARADAGRAECTAFLAAGAAEQRGEYAEAVRLYGEFRRANPGTALAAFVDDDLRRTYEGWGTRLRAAGDHDDAVRVYRDLLVEVGDGPEAPGVRAQIAAAYVEQADALRGQLGTLTGQPRVDAVRRAIENLLVVSREFADTPSAPAASQGIIDTYTAAAAVGGCEAVPALDHVVALTDAETAGIVAGAVVDRPVALFGCGLAQYEAGSWGEAATTFDRFVAEYPNDPQAAQARADAIAARASVVAGAPPAALPGPFVGDTPGSIPVTIYNDNPAAVRVYVLGPTAHEIVLPGCPGCPASYAAEGQACPTFDGRPSARLTLPAGDYTIISQYPASNPAVETSAVERGFEYTNCLYVGP